ncbi:DUF2971 domain-containing protein [Acidovorax sp. M2(2025)]|uniref:DUF2971 domain-containing protein n=1 Tax=Acidovorax sp. M2(2025) TaxID=3411355 RepID=UPI003BF5EEB7
MKNSDMDKAKPYFIHQGPIPNTLYRYRSLTSRWQYRNVLSEIVTERVFLASMNSLNDPDEGRLRVEFKKDVAAIFSYFYLQEVGNRGHASASKLAADRIAELVSNGYRLPEGVARILRAEFGRRIRIACFTTLPTNFLMWANYATLCVHGKKPGHTGICIEYAVSEQWRSHPLGPVTYSDVVPVYDPTTRDESALVKTYYMKSPEWSGESEWRITYMITGELSSSGEADKHAMLSLPGSVRAVIFGMDTPERVREKIIRDVHKKAPHIKFKHMYQDRHLVSREIRDL